MEQRILIYGGTALDTSLSLFVEELTFSILNHRKVTIVTGGFLHFHNNTKARSTDYSALCGAQRFAHLSNVPLEECLETWLPDMMKDRRMEGVERFKEGKVVTLFGESDQARRFAMVKHVDVVITISGKVNTEMVLDFAFTIGKPALPLSFSGGDSANYWSDKKEKIIETFGVDTMLQERLENFNPDTCTEAERKDITAKLLTCVDKALLNETGEENSGKQNKQALHLEMIGVLEDTDDEQMEKANPYNRRPVVFVSYSHKDAKWKEELDLHFHDLKSSNLISYWSDSLLMGGDEWDKKIKERLERADIILLLVSPEFMNSTYIENIELAIASKRHAEGNCRIIPLFVTAVDIEHSPIHQLQGYPLNKKPISSIQSKSMRAKVWVDIVGELKKVLAAWQQKGTAGESNNIAPV
jgi:hypothetical protein